MAAFKKSYLWRIRPLFRTLYVFSPKFSYILCRGRNKNKRQRTIIDNEYNFRCLIDKLNKFDNFFTAMISFDMIFKIVITSC